MYIIASFFLGAGLILSIMPCLKNRLMPLTGNKDSASRSFLFFPASYLIGTLILSWCTYFLAVIFKNADRPLFFANLFAFLLVAASVFALYCFKRVQLKKWFYELKKYGPGITFTAIEWFVLLFSLVFWSFFVFRSLYMDGNFIRVGFSAFSDFGAHLPVIRSFSVGQNFPAQYPLFPDGTMRYHFMFYFYAGNLEYLGFNLPWALNLPSILSLVSFSMLLYGLCVGITKRPIAGLLACVFFAFRSSFAFFTYTYGFNNISDFIYGLRNNLNADGSPREHIGNTLRESWGLWAQKVYINQRHLAFALGLFILALYLLLPLFMSAINGLKRSTTKAQGVTTKTHERAGIHLFITELFFKKDAWLPQSLMPCICSGLLLGLMAFWNGAVVIAAISVFFVMAALSKHKLEYLIMAMIALLLSVFQSTLFIGSSTGSVSILYKPGFLAESGNISAVSLYYTELLGILPFVLAGLIIVAIFRKGKPVSYILSFALIVLLLLLLPSVGIFQSIFIAFVYLTFLIYLIFNKQQGFSLISPFYIPVFAAPIILASTLQFTPDITVNHKYIILSVILLNIPVSEFLAKILSMRKKVAVALAICVTALLTLTGVVDIFTLYNLDKNSVSYNEKEPVKIWVQEKTKSDDLFLTHYMTHYGAPMSVMLAGRSLYSGYPYFTITAGYDVASRESVMKRIYGAVNSDDLRKLAITEGIDYIVIEEQNRTADEYNLNEEIFHDTFPVVFFDAEKNIFVFKVQ